MHEERYRRGSLECYEVMRVAFGDEAVKNFMMLSAFKYLWRYQHKGGVRDLDKAIDYINEIKRFRYDELVTADKEQLRVLESLICSHRADAIKCRKSSITNIPPESENPYQE